MDPIMTLNNVEQASIANIINGGLPLI